MTYLATSGVMWLLLHLLRTEPLLAFVGELAWRVSPAGWITSQLQQQPCLSCRQSRLPGARQRSC